MADDDADDDVVDDVIGSYDVTSGGRDTHVFVSLTSEEDGQLVKELAAECSEEDVSEMQLSYADELSESVDHVSEIADQDDDDNEDGSDYTMSESLEEKEQETLTLERSYGLVQSTRETLEYVDSDVTSGSTTSLKDQEMTRHVTDFGTPVARSMTGIGDYSADHSKVAENDLLQTSNREDNTPVQKHHGDSYSTDAQAAIDLEKRQLERYFTKDFKGADERFSSQKDDIGLEIDQKRQSKCTADVSTRRGLGQHDFQEDLKGSESTSTDENDYLNLTPTEQNQQEQILTDLRQVSLDIKQSSELEQDSNDCTNHFGDTFTLTDTSDAAVSSTSKDQTNANPNITQNLCSVKAEAPTDTEILGHHKTIASVHSGENVDIDGRVVSTGLDVVAAEHNGIQDGRDTLLEHCAVLRKVSADDIPSINNETQSNPDPGGKGSQEDEITGDADQRQEAQHADAESDSSLSVAHQDNGPHDYEGSERTDFQQDWKHPTSPNIGASIHASVDQQQAIYFEDRRTVYQDPDNSCSDSGLSTTGTTPDCLQLELLSKSVVKAGERHLELVQSEAASSTWSADEEKSNLLCLLDSRRRTEMDKNNWQLARHIQDEMSLVNDAELDDLENVQVSVKCEIVTVLSRFDVKALNDLVVKSNEDLLRDNLTRLYGMRDELEKTYRTQIDLVHSRYRDQLISLQTKLTEKDEEITNRIQQLSTEHEMNVKRLQAHQQQQINQIHAEHGLLLEQLKSEKDNEMHAKLVQLENETLKHIELQQQQHLDTINALNTEHEKTLQRNLTELRQQFETKLKDMQLFILQLQETIARIEAANKLSSRRPQCYSALCNVTGPNCKPSATGCYSAICANSRSRQHAQSTQTHTNMLDESTDAMSDSDGPDIQYLYEQKLLSDDQIAELRQNIVDKDQEIAELTNQLDHTIHEYEETFQRFKDAENQRNGRIDELKTEIVELQQQLDICQQKSSSDVSQIQTDLDNALADRDVTERLNERLSSLLSNVVSTSASVAASINEHLHHLQQQQQQVQRSQQTKIGYLENEPRSGLTSQLTDDLFRQLSVCHMTSSRNDLDLDIEHKLNGLIIYNNISSF